MNSWDMSRLCTKGPEWFKTVRLGRPLWNNVWTVLGTVSDLFLRVHLFENIAGEPSVQH